jgi:hypothetical protein
LTPTFIPAGVFAHISSAFSTPSLSASNAQPTLSTCVAIDVFAHWSILTKTPSLSLSLDLGVAGAVDPPNA